MDQTSAPQTPTDPPANPPDPNPSPTPVTQIYPPPSVNTPPSPIDTPTVSNHPLENFAKKFSINHTKPFFPVNTMRLFYLILTDGLTMSHHEAIDQVNSVIPKISTVFDARDHFLEDSKDTNPLLEVQTCSDAISGVLAIIDTPIVRHTFDLIFSDLYPLQENLLVSLDRHLNEQTLSSEDLLSILKIRAMDSVVYSSIINEIIKRFTTESKSMRHEPATIYQTTPLHWQVNLTLQINDLSDAIIHAKADLESGNATIVDILKKTISPENSLEKVVGHIYTTLTDQSLKLPFSQPLQSNVKLFNQALIKVVTTPPQS